jgi:hypothetical protein
MPYDFDALYREYLSDPNVQSLGYTSLRSFINQNNGILNDLIDDGYEIDTITLFIEEYSTLALANDPDWLNTYSLPS